MILWNNPLVATMKGAVAGGGVSWTAAAAAAAATTATLFACMDANPSLWFFERFVCTPNRLRQELQDKCIWITGASSGIGAELAQQLSRHGQVKQLILSARSVSSLEQVAASCSSSSSSSVEIVPLDVTDSESVEAAMEKYASDVDFLVLNAGSGVLEVADQLDLEETRQMFELNSLSPIMMAQSYLKHRQQLAANKDDDSKQQRTRGPRSHIVVTSSIAAKLAVPLSASYAASKAAVHAYFRSLQAECSQTSNVRIDLPCPGPVATDFHKRTGRKRNDKDQSEHENNNHVTTGSSSNMLQGSQEASNREMKMSAHRCAQLMIASMIMGLPSSSFGRETWICPQPTLTFLYLAQILPDWTQYLLTRWVGPKRVELFQAGLNLYDPASLGELQRMKKRQTSEQLKERSNGSSKTSEEK